jgi:hypothetical protein
LRVRVAYIGAKFGSATSSVRMRCSTISPSLGEDVDLAVPLVHVDANMVHGWPLPFCGVDRGVLLWGSLCHHVKREASRFITSTREHGGGLDGVAGASVEDLEGDAEAGTCRDSFLFTSSNAPSGREHDY